MKPSASSASTRQPSKFKRILVGFVVALVIGASLYFYGYWKGRSQLGAQKADYDSKTQGIQAQLDKNQGDLAAAQNQTRLFQAQADLYRAAIDLERRNFGLANTHLQESAALLGTVQNAQGVDPARLGALRDVIAKTNINVAVDLGVQRQQVLDLATQLEALTPGTAQPGSAAANAAPATSTSVLPPASTVATPAASTGTATDANTATAPAPVTDSATSNTATGPVEGATNTAASSVPTDQNAAVPNQTTAPAAPAPTG